MISIFYHRRKITLIVLFSSNTVKLAWDTIFSEGILQTNTNGLLSQSRKA